MANNLDRNLGNNLRSDEQGEAALRHQFLVWQCLLRQYAIRNDEGRPPQGGRAAYKLSHESRQWQGPIVVLPNKADASVITTQFRFAAKKTHDPRLRRETALKHLAEAYYQQADSFTDQLTALFALHSPTVQAMIEVGGLTLRFAQANQQYDIPCAVRLCQTNEPLYQFTYWHNYLFNATLPGEVDVVCFSPDWMQAKFTQLPTD